MGCVIYLRLSPAFFVFLVLGGCVFSSAGCNDTCVSFTSNGSGGSGGVVVSNPPPSCKLNGASGIVSMTIGGKTEAKSTPGSTRAPIKHLFVTLDGVDMHPSALAEDATPGWQPLAAQLQERPIQVDLVADARTTNSSPAFPDSVLPAGLYGQVRLRLTVPPANGRFRETNHCGDQALHCAVTSDGRALHLRFLESATSIRIRSENIDGQRLYVAPDGTTALTIELDPDRSFLLPLGDSFLLGPVFHVSVQRRSEIAAN